MIKLPWTSQPQSRNHVLFSLTFNILIHQNPFFTFCYLLRENSSMKKPVKLTSSCPDHLQSPFPAPSFLLPHPLPTNPSNTSSRRMTDVECLNISYEKVPLILVLSQGIYKNIYIICASSIQKIWPLLSTEHILSQTDFPQHRIIRDEATPWKGVKRRS